MIALRDLRALPMLGGQFERGLKEVNEQSGCSVEARYRSGRRQALKAPVSQQLSYDGTVFLFDPCLVVFTVRTRASKFDPMTQAVFDQPVIYELSSVVHVQRSQGKRQSCADALQRLDHQASLADHDRCGLSPSAGNIG